MSAKKLLTHIKQLKNCIIQPNKEDSSPSKLYNLFKKLKTKLKEKIEAKNKLYKNTLDVYLTIVINLLKFEKYRLTSKVNVKDSSLNPVGVVTGTTPVTEQFIKNILSENFIPEESDIKQGVINDCYLLAALKNIARENPKAIKKCFVASRNGSLAMRFYKVVAETEKEQGEDNKIKLTTKAEGRVMIIMDKTVLCNIDQDIVGNQLNSDPLSVWVNLMEKAYAIYIAKRKITDKDLNFYHIYGCCIDNWHKGENQLSAVEDGFSVIPTTAITGKKGICYLIDTRTNIMMNQAHGNNSNSGNPTTSQLQSGKINPSKILGIIEEALKEGKSVTAETFLEDHNCWKIPLKLENRYVSYDEFKIAFCSGHAYSVKGIKEVSGNKYIVLSNPHMNFNGIMITGDVLSYYGNKGDVYLTPENFSKYIRNYGINKLKRKER